ncbi:hypothetical protein KXD40_007682 [Peronospora effusa]|uniref:Uncharacterized protein n=1 Tax=Peronospora effusa TaxID=542832 RepID=A0A3M6VE79_9STRA|nr:hypothetical protein DD238_005391 [Peronospora effusa]RQM13762.1 hypothetical protein DD237_006069 [Peronospora effusa]UIZ23348.1 hypothetical protein KXD40_007682 [Peronospora effusa]CAI5707406.1 unnamed protein product [Peronospora effusa]
MSTLSPETRRHLQSQSQKLNYVATLSEDLVEDDPSLSPPDRPVDYHHPLVMAMSTNEILMTLNHRSRSETFVCTLQGIVFEDAKRQYHSKLTKLVALATNANTLGTQSNVLLAKKALRYRKAMETRRILV